MQNKRANGCETMVSCQTFDEPFRNYDSDDVLTGQQPRLQMLAPTRLQLMRFEYQGTAHDHAEQEGGVKIPREDSRGARLPE
jgi:hypothetical protein